MYTNITIYIYICMNNGKNISDGDRKCGTVLFFVKLTTHVENGFSGEAPEAMADANPITMPVTRSRGIPRYGTPLELGIFNRTQRGIPIPVCFLFSMSEQ